MSSESVENGELWQPASWEPIKNYLLGQRNFILELVKDESFQALLTKKPVGVDSALVAELGKISEEGEIGLGICDFETLLAAARAVEVVRGRVDEGRGGLSARLQYLAIHLASAVQASAPAELGKAWNKYRHERKVLETWVSEVEAGGEQRTMPAQSVILRSKTALPRVIISLYSPEERATEQRDLESWVDRLCETMATTTMEVLKRNPSLQAIAAAHGVASRSHPDASSTADEQMVANTISLLAQSPSATLQEIISFYESLRDTTMRSGGRPGGSNVASSSKVPGA